MSGIRIDDKVRNRITGEIGTVYHGGPTSEAVLVMYGPTEIWEDASDLEAV